MLYKLPVKVSSVKSNLSSGFTLIEVLVVIAMVGILSAIAAPSWLTFVARQRLNKANDSVLAALQEAQGQAKKTKRSYSVSVKLNNNIPQISVHPGVTPPPNTPPSNWSNIGKDSDIKPGQILLLTNINGNNTATNNVNTFGLTTPKTITFDLTGSLELPVKTGNQGLTAVQNQRLGNDKGLVIALATPQPNNPSQPSNLKRCVIVQTLIGGIRTAKDNDCN